jgi:hypothetical protein
MFGWFDAKRSEEFGSSIAKFFIEKMPSDGQMSDAKFAAKTEYLLTKMAAQIKVFKQNERLNIYKAAKLGNAFKWTLKDAGVDDALSAKLVEWLVANI